jgi:hypothetical protein
MSPDNRPVEVKNKFEKFNFLMAATPITLSTALWRPTSSAKASSKPSELYNAAACTPPVCL